MHNEQCSITIDKLGGGIVDFHLREQGVNPLNFNFLHQSKYHDDLYFKGHFLCLGRWGDPSPGELAAGLNKHGEFLKLKWKAVKEDNTINMSASSKLEGLSIERKMELSKQSPCFKIIEKVRNDNVLGRMYNMVQHPTIANPFLNEETIVECNATLGFDYAADRYDDSFATLWPLVQIKNGAHIKLDKPDQSYSSIFCFIVNPKEEYGWITAWSPIHNTLLGYIWKRSDYPWINHWLHWEAAAGNNQSLSIAGNNSPGKLLYRGLEFGATGIHKPFNEILVKNLLNVLGESSLCMIDAGEEHIRSFYSFMYAIPSGFKGVQNVSFNPEDISVFEKETDAKINIPHTFNSPHEF